VYKFRKVRENMSGLYVNDTFIYGVNEYLNIKLEPIEFTINSGGGTTNTGVSMWMHGVFLTKIDSCNQKGVVKINARILDSKMSEINKVEAVFVKHNEHTNKKKNIFKNLYQLKDCPQEGLYKKITFFFPMRNVVDKKFDEFTILKPETIEIEYEHKTETIACKD